ncbi:MAG: LacI family transcriptional regulator [Tepidibacter sp.]|jgi:LacI family transcriptional regulator|uniref:LacI family DNA-binding transcriptional regulator n=1 Tax=Tepidibacter sp. TaxID=2529387 RepID=UPI0025F39CDA|nr:LacI family DNA-binding transcriptional regulator [Tepidibacter sp.]MCT4508014.1 LacI family transcriptional regulator [Tepidibacter sp.]
MAITIKDIAKRANVSRTTVSRVLNDSGYVKEETRKKVMDVINELNYTPSAIARSLSTSKTNTIGVVVPEINNPFFGEIIKGISQVADENNFNIILCNTDDKRDKELKALKIFKEQRIEGIIITPTYAEDHFSSEYLNTLEQIGIPVILLDGYVKYSEFSGIFIDHVKGAYDATSTLINAGHRKIAIINGKQNYTITKDRFKGYVKALNENNILIEDKYVFYGDFDYESAYKITKKILSMKDRPSAIFVTSNMMILGTIKAIYEQNINIPKDMAIIGFDKLDLVNILGMNISSVNGPTIEMGKAGMKMLMDKLNNVSPKDEIKRRIIIPQLMLKGSEKFIR